MILKNARVREIDGGQLELLDDSELVSIIVAKADTSMSRVSDPTEYEPARYDVEVSDDKHIVIQFWQPGNVISGALNEIAEDEA
ncbi:MAG: hypothetical protein EP318_21790 [Rhodobacteraceae bacterium]|nr:MAG: hypothetical protein EP318_21790 [Paracoccaceae bacterium]